MKTTRIALAALALLALLGQAALSAEVWQEERITTGHTWFTGQTLLWEDKIYWTDRRSGHGEVYVYDPVGGERPLIAGPDNVGAWSVYGDKLAIAKYVGGQYDLYTWSPSEGMTTISTASGNQQNAVLSDKLLAWEDYRSGTPQVYVYDPVNGERPINATSSRQTNPRVWGDQVVYEDDRAGRTDVYLWNPRDGERKLSTYISGMQAPTIYEGRVTMWLIGGSFPEDRGLWEWTSEHGLRQLAQWGYTQPDSVMYARMWGSLVVWQQGIGPSGIGAWDSVHGVTRVPQMPLNSSRSPSIYGNQVAWVGDNDIYLSTLVPEPPCLAALGLSACLLWPIMRRTTRA